MLLVRWAVCRVEEGDLAVRERALMLVKLQVKWKVDDGGLQVVVDEPSKSFYQGQMARVVAVPILTSQRRRMAEPFG